MAGASSFLAAAENTPAASNLAVVTWKLSATESNVSGATFTYSDAGEGEVKYSEGERSYIFKPDSRERLSPMGVTEIWRQVDDRTWQRIVKSSGRLVRTETTRIAPDGQTMEICV